MVFLLGLGSITTTWAILSCTNPCRGASAIAADEMMR